jgi:hypothetical protein
MLNVSLFVSWPIVTVCVLILGLSLAFLLLRSGLLREAKVFLRALLRLWGR